MTNELTNDGKLRFPSVRSSLIYKINGELDDDPDARAYLIENLKWIRDLNPRPPALNALARIQEQQEGDFLLLENGSKSFFISNAKSGSITFTHSDGRVSIFSLDGYIRPFTGKPYRDSMSESGMHLEANAPLFLDVMIGRSDREGHRELLFVFDVAGATILVDPKTGLGLSPDAMARMMHSEEAFGLEDGSQIRVTQIAGEMGIDHTGIPPEQFARLTGMRLTSSLGFENAAASSARMDPYKALELAPKSSVEQAKKQYRKLAMRYHPDRNPGDATAIEKFRHIQEAYELLSDPRKKADYDRAH